MSGDDLLPAEAKVQEELGHAQQFAARIKELYGVVPGSLDFEPEQSYLQPPSDQVDIVHVIRGVIEAEDLATILRYGALPTTLERERVESVSASLGEDALRAGLIAGRLTRCRWIHSTSNKSSGSTMCMNTKRVKKRSSRLSGDRKLRAIDWPKIGS